MVTRNGSHRRKIGPFFENLPFKIALGTLASRRALRVPLLLLQPCNCNKCFFHKMSVWHRSLDACLLLVQVIHLGEMMESHLLDRHQVSAHLRLAALIFALVERQRDGCADRYRARMSTRFQWGKEKLRDQKMGVRCAWPAELSSPCLCLFSALIRLIHTPKNRASSAFCSFLGL